MSAYFDEIFSKYQYSFRKGYSTQQCQLTLPEKWKAVDKGKVFGALLTDLLRSIKILATEMYKVSKSMPPRYITQLLAQRKTLII